MFKSGEFVVSTTLVELPNYCRACASLFFGANRIKTSSRYSKNERNNMIKRADKIKFKTFMLTKKLFIQNATKKLNKCHLVKKC